MKSTAVLLFTYSRMSILLSTVGRLEYFSHNSSNLAFLKILQCVKILIDFQCSILLVSIDLKKFLMCLSQLVSPLGCAQEEAMQTRGNLLLLKIIQYYEKQARKLYFQLENIVFDLFQSTTISSLDVVHLLTSGCSFWCVSVTSFFQGSQKVRPYG